MNDRRATLELELPHLEDALIAIASSNEEVSRAVITSSSTTFLAHNTVAGYSAIDFHRPANACLKELSALLEVHCDLHKTDQFYAGLYRDMIRLMSPGTELFFTKDGRAFPGTSFPQPTGGPLAWPASEHPTPSALVAFGDSFTYGQEIDTEELGRIDDSYRNARAYPTPLARELAIPEVINQGQPGASNAKIIRNLCDFVSDNRRDLTRYFFVISLTHPSRKAFIMRNGGDGRFISRSGGKFPEVLRALCMRAFFASKDDARANDSVNEELSHKITMVAAFMRRMGCRFVIFPAWNFALSARYFQNAAFGREVALSIGESGVFGMKDLVSHLPLGPGRHPLSGGHAHFARELAALIHQRNLYDRGWLERSAS